MYNYQINRENDERIDELEAAITDLLTPIDCPVTHRFTDGMYIREIFMPAGSLITSKIHNTQHPYVVSKGVVSVRIDMGDWVQLEAPFTGITKKGTRRVLYVHEDTIWTTFHPIQSISGDANYFSEEEKQKLVDMIEDIIIEKHYNPLLNKKEKEVLCHG